MEMTAAVITAPWPGPRRRGDILAPLLSRGAGTGTASAPGCRVIFFNDTFWFQVFHTLAFASQANIYWLETTARPFFCGRRRDLAPPGPFISISLENSRRAAVIALTCLGSEPGRKQSSDTCTGRSFQAPRLKIASINECFSQCFLAKPAERKTVRGHRMNAFEFCREYFHFKHIRIRYTLRMPPAP